MSEITADIYDMLDKAGVTAGEILNSRESIQIIINRVRTKLANEIKDYIEKKDIENGSIHDN